MTGIPGEHALRIAVLGAGRMGRELVTALAVRDGATLAGVWARDRARLINALGDAERAVLDGAVVSADLAAVLDSADVAVDFTLPGATPSILEGVLRSKMPLVCGVSGLGDETMSRLREASSSVPVFHDRNMSLGIAVLTDLVRRAGIVLGPEFVAEIHETHHVHKLDAPSGTALKLGEALADARGRDFRSVYRYDGDRPPRRASPAEIVFTTTREGENPGEHTVAFRSEAETVELTHRVRNRQVFALGALQAARWLVQQPPGLYGMRDLAAPVRLGRPR